MRRILQDYFDYYQAVGGVFPALEDKSTTKRIKFLGGTGQSPCAFSPINQVGMVGRRHRRRGACTGVRWTSSCARLPMLARRPLAAAAVICRASKSCWRERSVAGGE